MAARSFDIVLFGATGFAGKLTAQYLARHAPPSVRWAIAGRSEAKLEAVRASILDGGLKATIPSIIASSDNVESLDNMTSQARVVITTVGPYLKYGPPLVESCLRNKTHYVDITGESIFVKAMIDAHHETARRDGVLFIPMSAFDSVPSDLGAFMMVEHARRVLKRPVRRVDSLFTIKGGASGGTIASGFEMVKWKNLKKLTNSRLLCDTGIENVKAMGDGMLPGWNSTFKRWTSPFVMAGANTRVVRRSAALLSTVPKQAYSSHPFEYTERMSHKGFIPAVLVSISLMLIPIFLLVPPLRWLLSKIVSPPGTGPSPETRAKSFFRVQLRAVTDEENPQVITGRVSGGDPGYDETAKMIAEAALTIVLHEDELGARSLGGGGFLTPAAGLGLPYLRRLRAAGIVLEVDGEEQH